MFTIFISVRSWWGRLMPLKKNWDRALPPPWRASPTPHATRLPIQFCVVADLLVHSKICRVFLFGCHGSQLGRSIRWSYTMFPRSFHVLECTGTLYMYIVYTVHVLYMYAVPVNLGWIFEIERLRTVRNGPERCRYTFRSSRTRPPVRVSVLSYNTVQFYLHIIYYFVEFAGF